MNTLIDTSILDKAVKFAIKAHEGIERRGKGYPYSVHLMEAVTIAATMTSDQEILAAAMLHDVLEDTPKTSEDIRKEFGDRVTYLVESETDIVVEGKTESESWYQRKQYAMDRLKKSPKDVLIVALGDKLSNMRSINRDFKALGNDLWQRFHMKNPSDHEWHYRGLLDAMKGISDTDAYKEFELLINETFKSQNH